MVGEMTVEQANRVHARHYGDIPLVRLRGPRAEIDYGSPDYPEALVNVPDAPHRLYVVGNVNALQDGLAIIGARKATPYGKSSAYKFASLAAQRGIPVVSGGALGCDSEAHEGALSVGGITVAVLGGGCDRPYPVSNTALFQRIVDAGGAVVSERDWEFPPLRYTFRARNRIIAGLSRATLIVEAGLPSGTFSTADDALASNREVLVVPGAITSATSRGANRLIYQGATPIIDDETFEDAICSTFGLLRMQDMRDLLSPERIGNVVEREGTQPDDELLAALCANPLRLEQMLALPWVSKRASSEQASNELTWVMMRLATYERDGLIVRFPDGRYGPARV